MREKSHIPEEIPVKFCKDCKYYDRELDGDGILLNNWCNSHKNYFRDIVTGERKRRFNSCQEARADNNSSWGMRNNCGPDGYWFVSK